MIFYNPPPPARLALWHVNNARETGRHILCHREPVVIIRLVSLLYNIIYRTLYALVNDHVKTVDDRFVVGIFVETHNTTVHALVDGAKKKRDSDVDGCCENVRRSLTNGRYCGCPLATSIP